MIPKTIETNEIEVVLNHSEEVRVKRSLLLSENSRLGDEFTEKCIMEYFNSPRFRELNRTRSVYLTRPYVMNGYNDHQNILITNPKDVLGHGYYVSTNNRETKFLLKVPDPILCQRLKSGALLLTFDGLVMSDGGEIINARLTYRENPEKPVEEQNLTLGKG